MLCYVWLRPPGAIFEVVWYEAGLNSCPISWNRQTIIGNLQGRVLRDLMFGYPVVV